MRIGDWSSSVCSADLGLSGIGGGGGLAAAVTGCVERRTLRRADRVVVIHERFKERLLSLYGLEEQRVVVLRNWTCVASVEVPDVQAGRDAQGWGDETVVIYTGNFGAKQGLEAIVEAARLASDSRQQIGRAPD